MSGILLLLGTNLGQKKKNLQEAKDKLTQSGIRIIQTSSLYESAAWGIVDQPAFLNQVIEVETNLKPQSLLSLCLRTETAMGRVRKRKWGERMIDIDILFYGNLVMEESNLNIPHPGIPNRNFTLLPLSEKWPNLKHPISHQTPDEMLRICNDDLHVNKLEF